MEALGVVPVLSAHGDDITRSAGGRHAGELVLLLPAVLDRLAVRWRGDGVARATVSIRLGRIDHAVTIAVDPAGRSLRS